VLGEAAAATPASIGDVLEIDRMTRARVEASMREVCP
jgi:hypothetical protein